MMAAIRVEEMSVVEMVMMVGFGRLGHFFVDQN